MEQKLADVNEKLQKAVKSLKEALEATPRSDVIVAGIIKNFEFTYELAWKALKRLLLVQGIECLSPRQTFAAAYLQKIIADEKLWLKIIDDRNLTVHTYDEEFARAMVMRIEAKYYEAFEAIALIIQSQGHAL